ncbi:MAG: GGDEF domain-containing protein [Gammaproteobacteria bacterium]|nr:GGDEF domain-containing protein [Gammaproteobacteria bacterium]
MPNHAKYNLICKNAINCSSFVLILIIFLVMIWTLIDKYQGFKAYRHNVAETAIKNTRDAISEAIANKKRILNHYVNEHRSHIVKLVDDHENQQIFDHVYNDIKLIFPDLFTINIADMKGRLKLDDFDGFTGDMCLTDLKEFSETKLHLKRTHPNHILYHYDEITSFRYKNNDYLFFTSFSLDQIVSILRRSTPKGYYILIINESSENAILEITAKGGRDKIANRTDFRLNEDELNSINIKEAIPETHWTIVNLEDNTIIYQELKLIIITVMIIFVMITAMILYMRKVVTDNFRLIELSSIELMDNNKKISELNVRLEQMSMTDALTGIYNRRFYDMQIDREWRSAIREQSRITLFMIDIDYFKKYNDTYGHVEGDICLRKVAQLIKSCFNRSNEYVARFGGEEFVVISHADSDSCLAVAEAVHEKIKNANIGHSESELKRLTVSIGIASMVPDKMVRQITLVERADIALYTAKNRKRNQTVVYDKSLLYELK